VFKASRKQGKIGTFILKKQGLTKLSERRTPNGTYRGTPRENEPGSSESGRGNTTAESEQDGRYVNAEYSVT